MIYLETTILPKLTTGNQRWPRIAWPARPGVTVSEKAEGTAGHSRLE